MWHLITFCGLRQGERRGMRQPWSETNLDDHSLTVSAQLVQDGWEVETSEPKADNGLRVVALDDDTVGVRKRHREEWGSARVDTGMVFTQEDGSWLHPGQVTDLFERSSPPLDSRRSGCTKPRGRRGALRLTEL